MGTNNRRKIIALGISLLCLLFLVSCSKDKKLTQEQIQKELKELVNKGYTTKELALRTYYTEEELVACLHGEEMKDNYFDAINRIYEHDRKERMIPVHKVGKTATECLRSVYNKSHGALPILSQYLNVNVASVANALTGKKMLNYEDSLRVLIAYINMSNQLDTIPVKLNIAPYYYNNNEGIENIHIPQQSVFLKSQSTDIDNKQAYYVWQAEQFELEANKKLEQSINYKIKEFADKLARDFIEDDIENLIGELITVFKDDAETKEYYIEKFKKRFDLSGLSANIKDEIISYCVSINCSRILTINEILGYNQLTNNLSVAQKTQLDSFAVSMEKVNALIGNRQIDHAKTLTSAAVSLLTTTGGGWFSVASLPLNVTLGKEMADLIDKQIRGEESIDVDKQIQEFQELIYLQIKDGIETQLQHDNYKIALDQDTRDYYRKVKLHLNLK